MYYLHSEHLSAIDNMLIDSYLVSSDKEYFRTYTWINPTISLGVSNSYSELNLDYIQSKKIDVIKRETGGGILYHDHDLCFSIINHSHLKPKENYLNIKTVIEQIFSNINLPVTKTTDTNLKSSVCFSGSNEHEISISETKVVGIAQKKIGNKYLIQGSIQFATHDITNMITDSNGCIQHGIGKEYNINTIKDVLYYEFARINDLSHLNIIKVINSLEYLVFKEKNASKFYKDIHGS